MVNIVLTEISYAIININDQNNNFVLQYYKVVLIYMFKKEKETYNFGVKKKPDKLPKVKKGWWWR